MKWNNLLVSSPLSHGKLFLILKNWTIIFLYDVVVSR